MKSYLLRPLPKYAAGINPTNEDENNPWYPWYDKCFGMVVCAGSVSEARSIANDSSKGEENEKEVWLSEDYTSCEEINTKGLALMSIHHS